MPKIQSLPIATNVPTSSQFNEAMSKISTAFSNTLSRDGSLPNTLDADLDLNSNDVLNANNISTVSLDVSSNLTLNGQALSVETIGSTDFNTRNDFVLWNSLNTKTTGIVVNAAGFSYRYLGTGSSISDLLGWVPFGYAYPDHWKQNTTPGTTDMSTAISSALAYSNAVYVTGTYATSSTVELDDSYLFGCGAKESKILGLSTLPVTSPLVAISGQGGISDVTLAYSDSALTFSETRGQRVLLSPVIGSTAASKGAFAKNLILQDAGTSIYAESASFNVHYENIFFKGFTYRAWDCPLGTGNTFAGQCYIEGYAITSGHESHIANAAVNIQPGAGKANSGTASFWQQINVHVSRLSSAVFKADNLTNLTVGAMHVENCVMESGSTGVIDLNHTNLRINSFQVLGNGFNAMTNPCVFYLREGKAAGDDTGGATLSDYNTLHLGNFSVRGMNNPASKITGYTPSGLENLSSWKYARRAPAATGTYFLTIDALPDYVIYSGNDTALERAYTRAFYAGIDPEITVTRIGSDLHNFVKNGAFDNWTSTSVSSTGGTEVQGPTNWYAAGTGSATIRVTQVAEPLGSENPYHARFENLGTSGSTCRFIQHMGDASVLSGKTCVLSFEAYAATAGRALEDILCSLANASGTPTSTFARVVLGSDTRCQFTTSWKRFEFVFTFPTITTLGAGATFDLTFRITDTGGTRESDIHIRNVQVQAASSVRPFKKRTSLE